MKILLRLFIGINGPPIIGFLIFTLLFSLSSEASKISENIDLFLLFMAYMFVGIQSIIYAFVMEFVVPKYVNRAICFYMAGAFMGYISGLSANYFMENQLVVYSGMAFLGSLVGFILSVILLKLRGANEIT